jgi:HEAT repeat protein
MCCGALQVRHEAAEALGAIGGEETERILRDYEADAEDVVRESALVALDTMDYWSNFQEAS